MEGPSMTSKAARLPCSAVTGDAPLPTQFLLRTILLGSTPSACPTSWPSLYTLSTPLWSTAAQKCTQSGGHRPITKNPSTANSARTPLSSTDQTKVPFSAPMPTAMLSPEAAASNSMKVVGAPAGAFEASVTAPQIDSPAPPIRRSGNSRLLVSPSKAIAAMPKVGPCTKATPEPRWVATHGSEVPTLASCPSKDQNRRLTSGAFPVFT
mmetsp:Transcript_86660/g.279903  ORF Transcript_86660/g.279903 Transcript_86660/m.279903 type:complete len:209 (+) Transcript_86660:1101-1727(+)